MEREEIELREKTNVKVIREGRELMKNNKKFWHFTMYNLNF